MDTQKLHLDIQKQQADPFADTQEGQVSTPINGGQPDTLTSSGLPDTPTDSGQHDTPTDSGQHDTPTDSGQPTKVKLTKKENLIQTLKFVIFSATAGIIQTITFTLMFELGHLPYWPSYLTALVLSVLYNFTINRKFTFKSANNVPIAMLKVAAYYAVFTPASTLWGKALTDVGWNEYLVLFLTMLVNLSTEFLFNRFVVYRNSINTNSYARKQKPSKQ